MTLFWITTAAMIFVALALLAPTLLRNQKASSDVTEKLNVQIARERLADLSKEHAAGELSDEEFAQVREDLELALAQDLEGTARASTASGSNGRGALLISALVIPLVTIPLYLEIGSPQLIESMPGNSAVAGHGTGTGSEMPPISELVTQLRQRMEANPDNAEGWFLLGRTYMRLQNYPDAVMAFEKVVALLPEEPAGLLSLADAMTMRDGRQVGPKTVELLQKALSLDPNSVTALWLLGNAAYDKGDSAAALDFWQRAYPLLSDEPAMQGELAQRISQAGGEPPAATAPPSLPPIMAAAATGNQPVAPAAAPPVMATAPAPGAPPVAGGASITVEVALSPDLMAKVEASDTVFVLARAESGPPMPLAVARHQASELPLRVTLTDAMAMMPAMKLSSFPRVKISAKVSKSGRAGTQPGDMIAGDQVVDSTAPPDSVQLLIDQLVQ